MMMDDESLVRDDELLVMDDELLCDTLVDSSLDLDDDTLLVGFGDAVYGSLDGLEVSGAVFGNNDGVGG